MRQIKLIVCLVSSLAALLGAVTPAYCKVVSYGVGLNACEAYLSAREQRNEEELSYIDWLSGYMSGLNALSNRRINSILGDTNLQGTVDWLGNFCRKHPQTPVAVALDLLAAGARYSVARETVEVVSYGSGFKSCAAYLEARQQGNADQDGFVEWLGGYYSGVNAYSLTTDSVLGTTELTGTILWIDAYCQAHPAVRFDAAAAAKMTPARREP